MAATEPASPPAGPPLAPVPPQNLDAEENILGACMLNPGAIDACQTAGLQASDFYREGHGRIWNACLALRAAGDPVDAITVAEKLRQFGHLDQLGTSDGRRGEALIHELAILVPAAANAGHYARIVVDAARRRQLIQLSHLYRQLGYGELPGTVDEHEQRAREAADTIGQRGQTAAAIALQTHQQVLETEIVADRYLIDDLIPVGAVGTIAAVPEAHKSWLAQAIAVRVAAGAGWILGKEVVGQTPVGYLWQDDSTNAELARVKLFEDRHPNHGELPMLWGLNLGIELPRDLIRLRTTVQQNRLGLLILDSFYNFVTADLKDEIPEQIVATLKREICDQTGCTILIVDHMPWATDVNRQRLRAYGGVFKNAATRFGIYLDVVGDKLHIEARGNNISGIPRRLAYWDPDALELKLLDGHEQPAEERVAPATEIADWVRQEGGDVKASDACLVWEISADTLRRRAPALRDLGIDYVGGPGRPARLIAREPDTSDKPDQQLEMPQTQTTQSGNSPDAAFTSLNQAEPNAADANDAQTPMRHSETVDLQAKPELPNAAPPKGGARTRARTHAPAAAHAREDRTRYVETEGWQQDRDTLAATILNHWPNTTNPELAQLLELAARREAEELGGG